MTVHEHGSHGKRAQCPVIRYISVVELALVRIGSQEKVKEIHVRFGPFDMRAIPAVLLILRQHVLQTYLCKDVP